MYRNVAYLGKLDEDIVDHSAPLLVTAAGYYCVQTSPLIETKRPNGRNDYQIIYVYAGKLHVYIHGKERVVERGALLLFRPHEAQIYKYYSSEKPEIYWVHFTGFDVENLLERYEIPNDKNVFVLGNALECQWLFKNIIHELQVRRKNYAEFINMNLCQVLLLLNRCLEEEIVLGFDDLNEVDLALNFFNEKYNTSISVKDYAEERHISVCWFNRIFKRVTQKTPMQYIINLRIANALDLLHETTYNIIQIANIVGYDDAYYFSRIFKKHVGMSPREYRKTKVLDIDPR